MAETNYRVNGHEPPPPTSFQWMPRRVLDTQADGRPLYGATRAVQLRWNLVDFSDFQELQAFFRSIQSTGLANIRVPEYPTMTGTPFAFHEYSGCTMAEPEVGPMFLEEYPTEVMLLIANIVTE